MRIQASIIVGAILSLATPFFVLPSEAAVRETVLWNFCTTDSCTHINKPAPSQLLMDSSGNLYGTTAVGSGSKNFGAVYELTPKGKGWKYTELHSFDIEDLAGAKPYGGLIMDTAGNLYGTASAGGNGAGTVFELSKTGKKWRAKALHQFCSLKSCKDGQVPYAGLTYAGASTGALYDGSSPLYGVTYNGVTDSCTFPGCGVVFSLTPNGKKWTETVLYTFCQKTGCDDGAFPGGPLTLDSNGNLFGVTAGGGTAECSDDTRCGTVYELTPKKGKWSESVLYNFCSQSDCADGQDPEGGLIADSAGNLYGTTYWGGSKRFGTIFKMTYGKKTKSWTHSILYNFCTQANCADGSLPEAGLIMDSKGNLYGTTSGGGNGTFDGTVFELGSSYSVLYKMCGSTNCTDGAEPESSLIFDKSENLYGATTDGGSENNGTVFKITH
jgi:uncharacterized repeat protein (TIGR03803 family)